MRTWPGARLPRQTRDTLFLVAVTAWTCAPHLWLLPGWCTVVVLALLAWRVRLSWAQQALPSRWTTLALLGLVSALTWWEQKTLIGREPGVTLLVMLMALKTLELRARRDAVVVFYLGFFLVLAQFMESQSLLTALGMVVNVLGLLTLLVMAHLPAGRPPLSLAAGWALKTMALGSPLMLALFLLFPRIGPLWGLPSENTATTGLSNQLRMGQVAQVVQDESIALRVKFDGPPPPRLQWYFRGPVLSRFDGQTWTAEAPRRPPSAPISPTVSTGPSQGQRYEMLLEPQRQTFVPLLDPSPGRPTWLSVATEPPGQSFQLQADGSWQSRWPLTQRLALSAQHQPHQPWPGPAGVVDQRDLVDLPPGFNPRTLAYAAQIRRQPAWTQAGARALTELLLRTIREEGFVYTLQPGTYGRDAVDEFWFDRRAGFCEHFAASFVVLMRALDIPARIVTGYQGSDADAVEGWWAIRQSHAHAWAEVWDPAEGWIRVDPTSAAAPTRVADSAALRPAPGLMGQMLGRIDPSLLFRLRLAWERVDQRWAQWVVQYGRDTQFQLLKGLGVDTPDLATLARGLVLLLSLAALAGTLWAWRERQRLSPWESLRRRLRRQLRPWGLAVADHEGPGVWRRALLALPQRHPQLRPDQLAPLAQLLQDLEALRYGMQAGTVVERQALRAWQGAWRQAWGATLQGQRPGPTQAVSDAAGHPQT